MSISCKSLYEDACKEVGVGVGSDRLASSFVRAVNRTLDQLAVSVDAPSKYSHISSTSDTITEIDSCYEYIIFAGIMYHIYRMGHKPSDPRIAAVVMSDSNNQWQDAKGDYKMDADNILQSDDEEDIIGLGVKSN